VGRGLGRAGNKQQREALLEVVQELQLPTCDVERRGIVRCLLGQLLAHWAGHNDGAPKGWDVQLLAMLNCLVWQSEAALAEVRAVLGYCLGCQSEAALAEVRAVLGDCLVWQSEAALVEVRAVLGLLPSRGERHFAELKEGTTCVQDVNGDSETVLQALEHSLGAVGILTVLQSLCRNSATSRVLAPSLQVGFLFDSHSFLFPTPDQFFSSD
jgi:hypothetical protein